MAPVVSPYLQIVTSALPNAETGTQFRAGVIAAGGVQPYHWSIVSGTLPPGLSIDPNTGILSGTASKEGQFDFSVQVSDSSSPMPQNAMKALTVSVAALALQITSSTLPNAQVGAPYQASVTATGGTPPYTWSVQSGQLPTGLSLLATGQITGTPSAAGQSSFTVQAADSASPPVNASKAFSLNTADASAPTALDQYGGDASHPCAGTLKNGNPIPGPTGFFYLYKDTNLKHWMYCDPAGNRFWMTSVQVVEHADFNIDNAKYGPFGSSTAWEAIQTKRLQAMGFNTVGEFSRIYMWQPNGRQPNPMPFIWFVSPAHYVLGLKDVFANLPPNNWFYRGFRSIDLWDPTWTGSWDCATNGMHPGCPTADASPWLLSVTMDDVAYLSQFYNNQTTFAVAMSAPYEQFENSNFGFGRSQVFADPVMHSKKSWSDWLCGTRYANLAALNAAWGSTYSTCGSTATLAPSETIGTGDGSTTSFTHTFAHLPIDPASVGISVGGVLQGGDTPWFNANNCTNTSGNGCVQAATGNINGSNINYSTGIITVAFSAPPAKGVTITATYHYAGWPKATNGGTGLLDEDGTSSWLNLGDPTLPSSFPDPPVGTVQTDMDVFLGLTAQRYFQPVSNWLRTNLPHHIIGGTDPADGYRTSVYQQMTNYVDEIIFSDGNSAANAAWQANTKTFYNTFGTPVYVGHYSCANPDSQYSAVTCPLNANVRFPTQSAKGNFYSNTTSLLFNGMKGSDGYGFISGIDYWQYTDNPHEQGAYGLVSLRDNLYNRIESCGKSITDPWGLTTTPESTTGCYGDLITPVKAGNRVWLGR